MRRLLPFFALGWMLAVASGLTHQLWVTLSKHGEILGRLPFTHLAILAAAGLAVVGLFFLLPRRLKPIVLACALLGGVGLVAQSKVFLDLPDAVKAIFFLGWSLFWSSLAVLLRLPLAVALLTVGLPTAVALLSPQAWKVIGSLVLVTLAASGYGAALLSLAYKLGAAWGDQPTEQGKSRFEAWIQFLVMLGVGIGFLSLFGLLLAEGGLARAPILGALLIGGLALSFSLRRGPRQLLIRERPVCGLAADPAVQWLRLQGIALLGLYLFAALAPETGSDALGGRVALAARVFAAGKLIQQPAMVEFTAGYAAGEVFYLWLFPWIGSSCARAWAWWVMVLWFIAAWLTGKRWPMVAWLAVFASTHAWWQTFSGFVDLHQAFLLVTAALALSRSSQQAGEASKALCTSFLAGSAITTKINALAGFFALVGWGAWQCRPRQPAKRWQPFCLFLGASLLGFVLAVGPWAIRAWKLTGNPTFPFFNGFWHSPFAPLEAVRAPFGPKADWLEWLSVPWTLFFAPQKFAELGSFNPVFLLLLPVLALATSGEKKARLFTWAFLVWLAAWGMTEPNSRYLWPGVSFLFAGVMVSTDAGAKLWRVLALPAGALALGSLMVQMVSVIFWPGREINGRSLPLAFVLGRETAHEYLRKVVVTYEPCKALSNRYNEEFRVWQVNLRDFLFCRGEAFDTFHGDFRVTRSLRKFLAGEYLETGRVTQALRQLGFTHVMYRLDSDTMWHWLARAKAGGVLSEAEEVCCLVPEFADNGVRVLRLNADPQGQGSWVPCEGFAVANEERSSFGFVRKYSGTFLGGDLLRLSLVSQRGSGPDPRANLAMRDADGKLLRFWPEAFGKRQEDQPIEIWQTIPEGGATVHLSVEWRHAVVEKVSCEVLKNGTTTKGHERRPL